MKEEVVFFFAEPINQFCIFIVATAYLRLPSYILTNKKRII